MGSCCTEADAGNDCAELEAGVGGPRVAVREGKKQRWLVRAAFRVQKRGLLRGASICPCADTHLDTFPNELTPMRDCLYLVDGGFALNSPFPLSLLPQRAVDLIVSFDYSLDAPFEVKVGGSLLR